MTNKEVLDIYKREYDSYVADVELSATKYEWAAAIVFDIYTDDVEIDGGIASHIIQICKVISGRIDRHDFLEDQVNYNIYMIICQFLRYRHWIRWDKALRDCWFTNDIVDCPDPIIDNEIYPEDGSVEVVRVPFSEENLLLLIDFIEEELEDEEE